MGGFFTIEGITKPTANFVTPEDFGAQGDGNDDTVSLQQWLDEADMLHWLPAGTWVTDPLNVPENCWIMGYGTLRLRTQNLTTLGDHGLLELPGTAQNKHVGARIAGITLDPNRAAHSGTPNANMEGIGADHAQDFLFDGVRVVNAIGDAFDFDNCERFSVLNCYALNVGKGGVHVSTNSTRYKVGFCTVDGAGQINTDRAAFTEVETASVGQWIGNLAVNSNKGYEIIGAGGTVGVGNIGVDNDNADETTGADSWT